MGNSYSEAAASFCQAHDITLIQAGCPMMFCEPVDFGHRCIRWWMRFNGTLPR
jgi:hypothetical protein